MVAVKSFITPQDAALFVSGKDPTPKDTGPPTRFYAVAIGLKPGVYTDWAEAQRAFVGSKGPKYKKFPTREEAESFVRQFAPAGTTRQAFEEEDDDDDEEEEDDDDDDEEEEEVESPPSKKARVSSRAGGSSIVNKDADLLNVWTDGSSLGNGKIGSRAGVGVFFGHGDKR